MINAADMIQRAAGIDSGGHELKEDPWLALVQDGADMQLEDLPELVQIVDSICGEQSKLVIVSSAKCFKTWLTIYLALSISHGIDFLRFPTQRRRIIYVNLELKAKTFTRRIQAIAKALNIRIDRQWFHHLPLRGQMAGVSVHSLVSRIIAVAKHFGAEVVIIDPVFKANTEGDENSSRDQTVFNNELDRITTEAGCTVILNDHSGKGNQSEKDPLDVIRGSSAKGGDLDAAMVLRRHNVDECFRVDMVHRELPPVPSFVVGWKYPLMQIRTDLDPDDMKKAKGGASKKHDPEKLCWYIREYTEANPISILGWAKLAGVKRTTMNDYVAGIRARNWIRTTGDGKTARQFLTDKGLAAAKRWQKESTEEPATEPKNEEDTL